MEPPWKFIKHSRGHRVTKIKSLRVLNCKCNAIKTLFITYVHSERNLNLNDSSSRYLHTNSTLCRSFIMEYVIVIIIA